MLAVKVSLVRVAKLLRMLAIAGLAAIAFWTVIVMIFEERFIFFPEKFPAGNYEDARFVPNMVDCWIPTEDDITIHGWFAPADSAIATLIISHGNAGNISHRLPLIRRLQQAGFNVLMYDYRGYGRSQGSPDEEGVYKDGRAAFDYALTLPGVDKAQILLWGTSLGGAVAVDVATHRKAAGLILESTFSSGKEVAQMIYPFLPVRFILHSQFNSAEKIRNVHIPLLFIHGTMDSIIPIGLGKKLFQAAHEPKEFYEIPNADHNDTFFVGGDSYIQRIASFAKGAKKGL